MKILKRLRAWNKFNSSVCDLNHTWYEGDHELTGIHIDVRTHGAEYIGEKFEVDMVDAYLGDIQHFIQLAIEQEGWSWEAKGYKGNYKARISVTGHTGAWYKCDTPAGALIRAYLKFAKIKQALINESLK